MNPYNSSGSSSVATLGTSTPQISIGVSVDATAEISGPAQAPRGVFVPSSLVADVMVVLVTYNNVDDIDPLFACLRAEAHFQSLKVVVTDNGSTDGTLERLAAHPDVILVRTGENLGFAGGLNAALRHETLYQDVLVLDPDLRILPGAIRTLRRRMRVSAAGIVVPRLIEDDGTTHAKLRREPTVARALRDATFGQRLPEWPEWRSVIDDSIESYQFPHPVEGASWAAVLLSGNVLAGVVDWDERHFLYSEASSYFRRVREHGHAIWFEPSAIMKHGRGCFRSLG